MTDFRIGNGMSAFHDAIPESGLPADGPIAVTNLAYADDQGLRSEIVQ